MTPRTRLKPALRASLKPVPSKETYNVELPPGLPDEEMPNVRSVLVEDRSNAPTLLPGDICVVWLGHPVGSGDFGAIEAVDGKVYLGTLRHGPGGYVTLTTEGLDFSRTFKPSEYRRLGRAFSIERAGKVVKRFGKGGKR